MSGLLSGDWQGFVQPLNYGGAKVRVNMRRKVVFAAMCALGMAVVFCGTLAMGDVIHLKDGRKLEGKIISETEEHVRLKMAHGEMTIERSDIEKIEKETVSDPDTEKEDKSAEEAAPDEVKKLKDVVEAKNRVIARLRTQLEELRKELARLKKELAKLKKELADAKKETKPAPKESDDEKTVPFTGEELSVAKMKADGIKNYVEKRFIIIGEASISQIYATGYRGAKKTHTAIMLYEVKNKKGDMGAFVYVYVRKAIAKHLVDKIVAAEKEGESLLIRAAITILRRKFDPESYDVEGELVNWQFLSEDGKWSKWVRK